VTPTRETIEEERARWKWWGDYLAKGHKTYKLKRQDRVRDNRAYGIRHRQYSHSVECRGPQRGRRNRWTSKSHPWSRELKRLRDHAPTPLWETDNLWLLRWLD